MLKHLHIRNLAIIDELELDLDSHFTALTGETGAGKSILIDAISLITGMRADSSLVRTGEEKAEVSAVFQIERSAAAIEWLRQAELHDADDTNACVIRRIVYAEGRTRAFVNGNPVNVGQLRELGNALITVFGQSESQTLLRQDTQRQLLDDFGGHAALLAEVAQLCEQYRSIEQRIQEIRRFGARDPGQLDYLRLQVQELQSLNLQDGELEQLEHAHRRLSHATRIYDEGAQAIEQLNGEDSAIYDQLSKTAALLAGLSSLDDTFEKPLQCVEAAQSSVLEASDALRRSLDRAELDPVQLADIEQRLSAVHDLARKHRVRPQELLGTLDRLQSELETLESKADSLDALLVQLDEIAQQYQPPAKQLHLQRAQAAQRYSAAISAIVQTLGMPNALFQIKVDSMPNATPQRHGLDDIRFDFSANPGQPPKPLAKVASGGELSRISLAIQVAQRHVSSIGTMIFDEVDAGIGGATAEIVGQRLRELGKNDQVLCVTHLAQVAAQSHHHFSIRKEVKAGKTYTRVNRLADATRVEEIARMQGGAELTASALRHARDLLQKASR